MEEQQETAGKGFTSGHGQDRKELWPRCYYETGR